MVTVNGAFMKKSNRGVILKNIIYNEYISRADISQKTGLNKATVSMQVAELLEQDLIVESTLEHRTIGRQPIMLSINGRAGYVLGIDLDYHQVQFIILNFQGQPIEREKVLFEVDHYEEVVQMLAEKINHYKNKYARSTYGLVHTIIGVHGIVDKESDVVTFVPRYGWKNKTLKTDLEALVHTNINIENNANLSAYAETVYKHHKSDYLTTILLSSGIGAGVIIDGSLYQGHTGHAGEIGHMIVVPEGKMCPCGNKGCWGLYASEVAVMNEIAYELGKKHITFQEIAQRIEEKDPIVISHLNEFLMYLTMGLNNVVHLYNPETIVLNSKLLELFPSITEDIQANINSSAGNHLHLVLSKIGRKSCALGAGALAIKLFLEVTEVHFTLPDRAITTKKSFHQIPVS